ncbi:MAG: hypothetical protein IJ060_05715 [Oscillospiraceae bacterium]|nr:hypothetical protein [Oscillospiraceae bacterium]
MLQITLAEIRTVLHAFQIPEDAADFCELQRYDYPDHDPKRRDVRLIVKAVFRARPPVVLRFKSEPGISAQSIEAQCRFAEMLRQGGIETPYQYTSGVRYAAAYSLHGYDVTVTAEDFCEGEVKAVDCRTARMTGELLARMHDLSEQNGAQLHLNTLFDPLSRNDLFDVSAFSENKEQLRKIAPELYDEIEALAAERMQHAAVFRDASRFAVQGDISLCNLYETADGRLGVFDFNNSGDNVLYYDAVMQAVFEATLMDYAEADTPEREQNILAAFLSGYGSIRPFTEQQREAFPHLYALLTAFASGRMRYHADSLTALLGSGRTDEALVCMEMIRHDLMNLREMP